jgi:hypothetical protein
MVSLSSVKKGCCSVIYLQLSLLWFEFVPQVYYIGNLIPSPMMLGLGLMGGHEGSPII